MGEPLNNYDAVLASIRGMSDSRMFKLSPRHITLSTVGVVPRMKQLTIDAPETQLALSLHAPNQASLFYFYFFSYASHLVNNSRCSGAVGRPMKTSLSAPCALGSVGSHRFHPRVN